jgi:hypothetical protein
MVRHRGHVEKHVCVDHFHIKHPTPGYTYYDRQMHGVCPALYPSEHHAFAGNTLKLLGFGAGFHESMAPFALGSVGMGTTPVPTCFAVAVALPLLCRVGRNLLRMLRSVPSPGDSDRYTRADSFVASTLPRDPPR